LQLSQHCICAFGNKYAEKQDDGAQRTIEQNKENNGKQSAAGKRK